MANKKVVCVDSCVFISFLKGEADKDRTTEEKSNLRGFFTDFVEGRVHIVFPTMERIEILACKVPTGSMELFHKFVARQNADEVPLSKPISLKAAEIRNELYLLRKNDPSFHKLSTTDAVVIATGIIYGCDYIYTYDGARTDGKDRRLLTLNGRNLSGNVIHIKRPESTQTEFAN